ncbi:MAG: hypothetical protein MZU97_09730 [Bacillus subtilis]|nr:hypothetical protein [Bacillus subtilis]
MIRLAVDAMGGDYAPKEQIEGAMLAIERITDIEIKLYGDPAEVAKYLTEDRTHHRRPDRLCDPDGRAQSDQGDQGAPGRIDGDGACEPPQGRERRRRLLRRDPGA